VERLAKLGPQVTRELGMAYAMFAIALPALAQSQQEPTDTPKEYRQFEKVEILGSAILQRESKASLPLRILTRQDISRRGLSSLDQAIHGLASRSGSP
jgi:hypothetical protein